MRLNEFYDVVVVDASCVWIYENWLKLLFDRHAVVLTINPLIAIIFIFCSALDVWHHLCAND